MVVSFIGGKSLTITELLSQSIMKLYRHVILACYTRVYTDNIGWCIYQRYIHTSIRISRACVYMNHVYEKQIKMCGYAKYRSKCLCELQYGSAVWYYHSLMHLKDWISIRFSSFAFHIAFDLESFVTELHRYKCISVCAYQTVYNALK